VTHPFHPWRGQRFELLSYRKNWREERVYFKDTAGRLRSLPAAWTTFMTPEPFVVASGGRSLFRVVDLLTLVELLRRLESEASVGGQP
jgi:hypothetical protein